MSERLLRKLIRVNLKEIKATIEIGPDPSLGELDIEGAAEEGLEFSLQLDPTTIASLVSRKEKQTGKRLTRIEKKAPEGSFPGLGTKEGEAGEEIPKTLEDGFNDIGVRFGKKYEDQALIMVQSALKGGSLTTDMLFNPSQVKMDTPIEIPGPVRELARLAPPAPTRGDVKGKGEILASLMFGLDPSIEEPDIVIPGKGGWHIKSFGTEAKKRTAVQAGEPGAVATAVANFINKYSEHGAVPDAYMGMKDLLAIEEKTRTKAAQIEFRDDLNALAYISVSEPNGTAKGMLRLEQEKQFMFIPANKVATQGINNGRLILDSRPQKGETPQAAIDRMKQGSGAPSESTPPSEEEIPPNTQQNLGSGKVYNDLRSLIRESLLTEDLTKSDKKEVERIAKKQAQKYFNAELDKALGTSFFGYKGKVSKYVEDEVSKRFKAGDKDKDFTDSVEKISKRVLQALYAMHYQRVNLIKSMPVPKS